MTKNHILTQVMQKMTFICQKSTLIHLCVHETENHIYQSKARRLLVEIFLFYLIKDTATRCVDVWPFFEVLCSRLRSLWIDGTMLNFSNINVFFRPVFFKFLLFFSSFTFSWSRMNIIWIWPVCLFVKPLVGVNGRAISWQIFYKS